MTFNGMIKFLEDWLDGEADQLPLWIPVGMGAGIIMWLSIGTAAFGWIAGSLSLSFLACHFTRWNYRSPLLLLIFAFAMLVGSMAIQFRSEFVASPILERPWYGQFYGRVRTAEDISGRDLYRLEVETGDHAPLPPLVRVNLDREYVTEDIVPGAIFLFRARLVPPSAPNIPSGYDFARATWFRSIGATGRVLEPPILYKKAPAGGQDVSRMRQEITKHIASHMSGGARGIAIALATGQKGHIPPEDARAMQDSGMAHLLAISGLHVSAIVAMAFLFMSRLLALAPWLALRIRVPVWSAAFAAILAVGYTILTGAQVPTVRACIAALMILAALVAGRDPLSLRLLAFAACIIMLVWPEVIAGPSFQLSFTAVTVIIILHNGRYMSALRDSVRRDRARRFPVWLLSLTVTGLAIEAALAPVTIYHFHRAGLYGAFANLLAIPLTSFVIIPAEALALFADIFGLGEPFWRVTEFAIGLILSTGHYVSALPGAITVVPAISGWAYGITILGGLWLFYWRHSVRYAGLGAILVGVLLMVTAPVADIVITGDGRHMTAQGGDGKQLLLRQRTGPYIREIFSEQIGNGGDFTPVDEWEGARCSADSCFIGLKRYDKNWLIFAIRSSYYLPTPDLLNACRRADIVISDRRLPKACAPKWMKADAALLKRTGGLAIYLRDRRVETVEQKIGQTPWGRHLFHPVSQTETD